MSKYNISDPDDAKLLEAEYNNISITQWEEYASFVFSPEQKRAFTFEERGVIQKLKNASGKRNKMPSLKEINWTLTLIERIEKIKSNATIDEIENAVKVKGTYKQPLRHVTFRIAWHDDKWNGNICKDPAQNHYCSGYHSLLSSRIRRAKKDNMDNEIAYRGKPVTDAYVPPCFWGINIFGNQTVTVQHQNPAAPNLNPIKEELTPNSLFSWNFALSFVRGSELTKTDGKYPRNLETVRAPRFQAKIHEEQSVAIIYTKFSNPITEEDQEYLVVGCGIVTSKGEFHEFGPKSEIEKIRSKSDKLANFPYMNWATRYSFHDRADTLVRMPYHEYLEHITKPDIEEEQKQKFLERIKVSINEPELKHCFKYVAMDVDDDEAIYILTKMRQSLITCKDDGIVPPEEMSERIEAIEYLLQHCWTKRGYFPGFTRIARHLMQWDKPDFPLEALIDQINENEEAEERATKLVGLINNSNADPTYRAHKRQLDELKSIYQESYGLSDAQFLSLCMLNLKEFQFERILSGKLKLSGDFRTDINQEKASHRLPSICDNPYLLYENYEHFDERLNSFGEEEDGPIELFKIDIAYFPDLRWQPKIDLQAGMSKTDKRRMRAIVIHYLQSLESNGHCFADAEELQDAVGAYPLFFQGPVAYQIPAGFFNDPPADHVRHYEDEENRLRVVSANDTYYYYLFEVHGAEIEIEKLLRSLLSKEKLNDRYDGADAYFNESCADLNGKMGEHFDEAGFIEERNKLYESIFPNRFFALTGNAGSGKSHELLKIVTVLRRMNQTCLILTPTGKAALRLQSDSIFPGIEAFTIDKVLAELKTGKMSNGRLWNYHNVIIDEMSMVDLLKFRLLISKLNFEVPTFKRLILVGDPNQLPAIGYGKVLRDILYFLSSSKEYKDNQIVLETNCRNELATSRILEFSEGFEKDGELNPEFVNKIYNGEYDESLSLAPKFDIEFWNDENELQKAIDVAYGKLVNRKRDFKKGFILNKLFGLNSDGTGDKLLLDKFQIITPYKSDFYGTSQINDYIQDEYRPEDDLSLMKNLYKNGDKIIRTKNYYEGQKLKISNGSIGLIRKKGNGPEILTFPDCDAPFPMSDLRKGEDENFELAYAITVHKAQGSGFDHTFFILPKKLGLLSRELVYTALTRSKKSITLFLQGSRADAFEKSPLGKAIIRSYSESRRTTLFLDKPYRYYSLESDGYFFSSKTELLIYQSLRHAQSKIGEDKLKFLYEVKPDANGEEIPIQTDFTIFVNGKRWLWEHLGKLYSKKYKRIWQTVKRPTYEKYGVFTELMTTDELGGVDPIKIENIVDLIVKDSLSTEDNFGKYSSHHYALS
jgi:hypothetical protein